MEPGVRSLQPLQPIIYWAGMISKLLRKRQCIWIPLSGRALLSRSDTVSALLFTTLLHHSDSSAVRTDPGGTVGHTPFIFLKALGADLKTAWTIPTEKGFFLTAVTFKFLFSAAPGYFFFNIHNHLQFIWTWIIKYYELFVHDL